MNETTRPVVLLADDDADYLDQLGLRFEREGWKVRKAHDSHEALTLLGESRPDLAVIDLMMERIDAGFTLAHRIKSRDETIPVLIVTGVTAETGLDFDPAAPGGRGWIKADAVLVKPVRFEQIRRELDRLGVHHG